MTSGILVVTVRAGGGRATVGHRPEQAPALLVTGHSRVETTKNIYGHLFAQDRQSIMVAMNDAMSRLYAVDDEADEKEAYWSC
jgi:hypothetical protein